MAEDTRGVFAISVAAEMVSMQVQNLRVYERRACSTPTARRAAPGSTAPPTSTGCTESATFPAEGLNLAGIARVLALEEEGPARRRSAPRAERKRSPPRGEPVRHGAHEDAGRVATTSEKGPTWAAARRSTPRRRARTVPSSPASRGGSRTDPSRTGHQDQHVAERPGGPTSAREPARVPPRTATPRCAGHVGDGLSRTNARRGTPPGSGERRAGDRGPRGNRAEAVGAGLRPESKPVRGVVALTTDRRSLGADRRRRGRARLRPVPRDRRRPILRDPSGRRCRHRRGCRARRSWRAPTSSTSWGSGPRCCSSPPRSARRAGDPAGAGRRRRRGARGGPRRGRRRAPPRAGAPAGVLRTPTTLILDGARRRGHPGGRRARARSRCWPPWLRPVMSRMWIRVHNARRGRSRAACRSAYSPMTMSSTMLTKRRAVDHCRVRSALCRMS